MPNFSRNLMKPEISIEIYIMAVRKDEKMH